MQQLCFSKTHGFNIRFRAKLFGKTDSLLKNVGVFFYPESSWMWRHFGDIIIVGRTSLFSGNCDVTELDPGENIAAKVDSLSGNVPNIL